MAVGGCELDVGSGERLRGGPGVCRQGGLSLTLPLGSRGTPYTVLNGVFGIWCARDPSLWMQPPSDGGVQAGSRGAASSVSEV